jgi:hypothetical protein
VQRSKGEKSYKGTLDNRRASAVAKFLKAQGLNLKIVKDGKDIKGAGAKARSVTVALTDADGRCTRRQERGIPNLTERDI